MAGCQHCSPYCDLCKPAAVKFRICPTCGKNNMYAREEILAENPLPCKKCGADVTALFRPNVVSCAYSGKLCAYPCGRAGMTPTEESPPCIANTPPSPSRQPTH